MHAFSRWVLTAIAFLLTPALYAGESVRPAINFDFNHDGSPDFVRRSVRYDAHKPLFSEIAVISGADGATLAQFSALEANDFWGATHAWVLRGSLRSPNLKSEIKS